MVRSRQLRALGLLAALGTLARCVPLVDQDGRPCPCTEPYRCCATTKLCIASDATCPADTSHGGAGASSSSGADSGGRGGHGGTVVMVPGGGTTGAGATSGGAAGAGAGGEAGDSANAGAGGAAGCDITPESCAGYARKSNVLVLVYNPMLRSGLDVRQTLGVPDARTLSARLVTQLREASAGLLNYELVESRELRAWPPQRPGTQPLNEDTFTAGTYDTNQYVAYTEASGGVAEGALTADYGAIFADQDLCTVVNAKNISEIWLWGAHSNQVNFGFEAFSYRLAGDALPASATDNDRALYKQRRRNIPDCGRTLFLLGAQYSEGVDATGNAHRSYNFRAGELIELALRTQSQDPVVGLSIWQQFSQIQLGPGGGDAQVGTPLFPPNAGVDAQAMNTVPKQEDYANSVSVLSGADRWISYPDLSAKPHAVQCSDWHCENAGFQSWYGQHIPRGAGVASGSCVNWWQYIADPGATLEPCCGEDCHPLAPLGRACAGDAECASGHCGCEGNAVCVEKDVGPCPKVNWELCDNNSDCETGICGCNGGAVAKCLPRNYASGCN